MKLPRFFGKLKKPKFLLRQVVGQSMAPTLTHGRLVLAHGLRQAREGDVVIIRHHGREKIKRIALCGQRRLYVVGDNPAASTDSRHFGWLPGEAVQGIVFWPRV